MKRLLFLFLLEVVSARAAVRFVVVNNSDTAGARVVVSTSAGLVFRTPVLAVGDSWISPFAVEAPADASQFVVSSVAGIEPTVSTVGVVDADVVAVSIEPDGGGGFAFVTARQNLSRVSGPTDTHLLNGWAFGLGLIFGISLWIWRLTHQTFNEAL